MFCPTCRIRCYKHGKDRKGNQRYRCQQCRKTVQDVPYKPFGNMRVDPRKATFCMKLLAEGNSIRSVERLTKMHRDTVLRVLVAAGKRCERLLESKIRGLEADDVQCDEIWGFGVCTSLPTTPHLVVGRSACRVGVGPSLNRSWAQRSRPVVQAGRRAFPGDESVVD